MSDKRPAPSAANASELMRTAFEPFQNMQSEMARMQSEMAKMFESFWSSAGSRAGFPHGGQMPAMRPAHPLAVNTFGPMMGLPAADVSETDAAFVITAELPGMAKDDVELSISDALLTIAGEKREATEDKRANFYMSERRFGRFQRTFPLPGDVDRDKITADFDKGVLTVTLPKTNATARQSQKVEIND